MVALCIYTDSKNCLRLQLHGAIYRPDSFVMMLRYCANLKAIRYESTSLNRIVADKSHRVIVALIVYSPARAPSTAGFIPYMQLLKGN